jgi:tRNA uridine 5-carbamoylmethylation protein Kti12
MLEKELAICMKARVPVLLQAAPGVGKTSIVQDIAKACNRELLAITVSGIEDMYVISKRRRNINNEKRYVASYLWNEIVFLACSHPEKYVLFMDEVNDTQMMNALQKLLVPGTNSCGIFIPDDLIIIAATNPPELSTTGQALTPPMASRFCILEVSLDESWQAFCKALKHGRYDTSDQVFEVDPPVKSIEDVDVDIREAVEEVCLRFTHGDAPRFNPDEYQNTVPRTIMYAMRCIAAARALGIRKDDSSLSRVLKGLIRREDIAAIMAALDKHDTLTWDKLLNVSEERLAKYNGASVSAAVAQAKFDNLIYVSGDGKSIKTDDRLVSLLSAMKHVCQREIVEAFVKSAMRYVIEILNKERELRMTDWDMYETFRNAVGG